MIKDLNSELHTFILEHENDDLVVLALSAAKYPEIDMSLALQQINGRQKVKNKLPTWYDNPLIYYPVKVSIEQSSSELTGKYKASLIHQSTITDLTGGMGVDTSFFTQVCDHVYYVERDSALCDIVAHNFQVMDVHNMTICHSSAEHYLIEQEGIPTDCYYVDPSRRDSDNRKMVALEDCSPKLSIILEEVIRREKRLLVKTSPLLDIKAVINTYPGLVEIHVVAINNECKELIFDFSNNGNIVNGDRDIRVKAVNILSRKDGEILPFTFTTNEERESEVEIKEPQKYLYEPNAAVMKSGGYKSLARKFSMPKLHRHTHLYTSMYEVPNFPGRGFEIIGISKPNKKQLNQIIGTERANLTVRNFPITVVELRKKLKLKDGGEHYIFACTISDGRHVLLVCKKL